MADKLYNATLSHFAGADIEHVEGYTLEEIADQFELDLFDISAAVQEAEQEGTTARAFSQTFGADDPKFEATIDPVEA